MDRYGTGGDFEALFADALDELLNAARLATVETWIGRAKAKHLSSSTIEVAKAELALREGKHLSAQTFAQTALTLAGDRRADAWRAAMVAGTRCPYRVARGIGARVLSRSRRVSRIRPEDKRDALWGQLMAASALELDEAHDLLDLLEATSDRVRSV